MPLVADYKPPPQSILQCAHCDSALGLWEIFILNPRDPERVMVHVNPNAEYGVGLGIYSEDDYEPEAADGDRPALFAFQCPRCGRVYYLSVRIDALGQTKFGWEEDKGRGAIELKASKMSDAGPVADFGAVNRVTPRDPSDG